MKNFLIALLLGVTMISTAQEKVLLRLNYEKGQKYMIDMKMDQDVGAGFMTNNMHIQMKYTITEVSDDTFESSSRITKMVMDMNQAGISVSYDSTKKDEELDETGKMMSSKMKPMLSATIITKGDNLGNVIETKVEPSNVEGADNFTKQAGSIVYPKEAVGVGDTWTATKSEGGMDFVFNYKVASISSKNVFIDISGEVSGIATGDINGSMNIERDSGMALESKISMTMKIQGQDATTNMIANLTKEQHIKQHSK
ncbi:DUF6263 family protein [Tenacibaculum tangerinum]|uniref:DUF6263 family protein n=1 Tax=Tenacibaculum tangerinum TaxID=3038772 RepID=A0ABY8L566_9FLAO|nr:DUF6263 family protein [Tenacibaculum tangerinum]WGH76414.1 DUF6263 family protein [Tenacibaculum tangerinum]